jgi:hypothetical protein
MHLVDYSLLVFSALRPRGTPTGLGETILYFFSLEINTTLLLLRLRIEEPGRVLTPDIHHARSRA